jgi:flagellar L-ring protein precursor FlgH
MRRIAILGLFALTGCGLGQIGQAPEMTSIGRAEEDAPPILTAERVALSVPPPQPARYAYQQGSLWSTTPTGLWGDRRARNLGDILTIVIEIDDEAEMKNTTSRSR